MLTMTKRFYPSSSAIHYEPLRTTYEEAVKLATQRLEDSDKLDEYYIVEIVAVVRKDKPKPPITVEKVRR